MKIRHVRAIAVFGIALVALTGARGSSGGGCDNSSSSSSSSGGSGSRDNDSSSSTGGSLPGGSSANKAARDVTIDECKLDDAGKNLTAKITISNSDSLDYDYDVTMKFTGDLGSTAAPATANKTAIAVAAGASETAVLSTPYTGTGDGTEYTKCEVSRASRS